RPLGVTVAPDGRTIAVAGNDGRMHVYGTQSGRLLHIDKDGAYTPVYLPGHAQVFDTSPAAGPLVRLDPSNGHIVRRYSGGRLWASSLSAFIQPMVVTPDG